MRFLALSIAVLIAVPAHAAETAWQEVAPDVSIRLISAGVLTAGGTTVMALEIDMPAGTKTYWRVPGETGLALDLDLAASTGVAGYQVRWPYPTREEKQGYLDYVYFGPTVLPLELSVSDPSGQLDMTATLGICSDICIPAQARFSLPLINAAPDRVSSLRIKQALAEVPIKWDEGAEPVGAVDVLAASNMLAIEVSPDTLDEASLIVATTDGDPLFGVPQKSPQPGLVLLPILGKSDNSALVGLEVELTFMTNKGAYVVSRPIGAGDQVSAAADTND